MRTNQEDSNVLTHYNFTRHFINFFRDKDSTFLQLHPHQKQALKEIDETNRNLLICAPTGSGKTLIFQIALLKSLYSFCIQNKLKLQGSIQGFKAIYMAPTKAVCQQKLREFNQHFSEAKTNLKLKIIYFSNQNKEYTTGITDILQNIIKPSNIIICTPQMYNYLLRKYISDLFQINIFLIDEIHMIVCQRRGYNLQIILNRVLDAQRHEIKDLRIVSVSASVPNKEEIALWLNAKIIQTKKKVVPLKLLDIEYYRGTKGDYHQRNSDMQSNLYKIIKQFERRFAKDAEITKEPRRNQNYLIFCPSKVKTKLNCIKLLDQIQFGGYPFQRPPTGLTVHEVQQMLEQQNIQNQELKKCILKRIAFHHAALKTKQKQLIIELMKKQWIVIIFCTSTLAQGVNLPVKAVIIMETIKFKEQEEEPYTFSQIDQMLGRAGRSKTDKVAYCCLMGRPDEMQLYHNLFQQYEASKGQIPLFELEPIKSNFERSNLRSDFVFFEINMRTLNICDQNTIKILAQHYQHSLWAIQESKQKNFDQIKEQIKDILQDVKKKFEQYELNQEAIKFQVFNRFISVNSYIEIYNKIKFQNKQQCISNEQQFLQLICGIDEMTSAYKYDINQDEKGHWNKIFKDKIPYQWKKLMIKDQPEKSRRQKIDNRHKIMFLVQIFLMGQIQALNTNEQLKEQCLQIMVDFKNICKLINIINFKSKKFRALKCQSLKAVFWSQLYLKYCNFVNTNIMIDRELTFKEKMNCWASHLNIRGCWESLGENFEKFGNLSAIVDTKYHGFFAIRDIISLEKHISNAYSIHGVTQNLFDQAKNIINRYQLCLKPKETTYLLSTVGQIFNISFYIFEKLGNTQVFKMEHKNMPHVELNNNESYIIIVKFEQVLGMDCICIVENGKIRQIRISSDELKWKELTKRRNQKQRDRTEANQSLEKRDIMMKKFKI